MKPDEACIRCGRKGRPTGLRRPEGPVCNSCAKWFREPDRCPLCGRMSRLLARVSRLGHDEPVCPACQRADHAICPACNRHRRLFESGDGSLLCRACLEKGTVPCPECGKAMPAGRGNRCEECYWKGVLEKRVAFCQAGLGGSLAKDFAEFGRWLEAHRGVNVAAIRINRYLYFFQEIDNKWGKIPEYSELVGYFHAEGLRRVRSVVRWMDESGRLKVDTRVRKEDSERRRIRDLTESVNGMTAGGVLWYSYRERLISKHGQGRTSLRSMRLALSAAADLVQRAKDREPSQADLEAYLLEKPGQKANITGFANHINRQCGSNLIPVVDARRARERSRSRLERSLIEMVRSPEDTEEFLRKWSKKAMRYFYEQDMESRAKIEIHSSDWLEVISNGKVYWVPYPHDRTISAVPASGKKK